MLAVALLIPRLLSDALNAEPSGSGGGIWMRRCLGSARHPARVATPIIVSKPTQSNPKCSKVFQKVQVFENGG
jgi:hypothetical protein